MIQRIQTVFLLGALAAVITLFFANIAIISSKDVVMFNLNGYHLFGISSYIPASSTLWLKITGYVLVFLILVTIFSFKNRKLQMQICLLNIFIALGLNGMIYYFPRHYNGAVTTSVAYYYSVLFPLVAVVLLFLAYRAIRKDDRLIKSLDRLR